MPQVGRFAARGRTRIALLAAATLAICSAAPAFAATGQVEVSLQYNSQVMLAPGQSLNMSVTHSACRKAAGATFGGIGSLNDKGAPVGQFTPNLSSGKVTTPVPPVTFEFPPLSGNDAVCTGTDSPNLTVPVPAGNYSEVYMLASANNGPNLVNITPVYTSGNGSAIPVVVNDWCAYGLGSGLAPWDNADGWYAGMWVHQKDGSLGNGDPCQYYTVEVQGLNPKETLTALDFSQAAVNTVIPVVPSVSAGTLETKDSQLYIGAMTLAGTALAASSSTGTTVPKTGSGPLPFVGGAILFGVGTGLLMRRRRAAS